MKKAPSFSMSMEKKSMPPLSMKGPWDGATKGLGLPPLAKKGFGDGAVGKTGFPSPPMQLKGAVGPISEVSDGGESVADDDNDSRAPGPGLPLKGGISTGVKQPEQAIKSMPFMKKAPSFSMSMEKKSMPPLSMKGPWDGATKGLGLPPLVKKGFGDGAVGKTGFPSPPMPLKGAVGPTSEVSDGGESVADDDNDSRAPGPGLPLKGGISTGVKQPEQAIKSMPFMKKAPSFSMSMEKKSMPPLSMKGPVDGATKGLGLPPLVKKGFGDGAVGKTGFPSPPMPLKGAVGPISEVSDGGESVADDDNDSRAPGPGLPLKGGISTGVKQPEQTIKSMPFMKKAPSFSMSMEKKSMPPLSMKGPWDGATKGLGLPPLAKKGFGDGAVGKTGFPSPPMPLKGAVGPTSEVSDGGESVADDNNDSRAPGPGLDFTDDFSDSKGSVSSWSSTPDKELGTGAPFLPQFAPPPLRGEAREPNDFSWLESAEAVELDKLAALEDASSIEDDARMKESRKPAQPKEATKLWSGESFLGKSSSRVYGLGSVRPSGFSGEKGNEVSRPKSSGAPSTARNDITDTWASEDTANSARLFEMNDAMIAAEKRLIDEKKESMITEEKRLIDEKAKIASLLSATEKRLSIQLEKFEKERQILRDDRAKFDAERSEAENRIREIESGRVRAEKEAELRFVEKNSALAAQLSDAERARTEDGKRLVEEKAKVAALISEAEKKVAIQLEKFKEERLKMNKEMEMASVEKLKAQKEVEEADLARKKAEEDARMLETLLSEQKMKQEKWMEEQKLRIEQTLEKRIAEEKSKMADEKAKEESKLAEEQKRLVEEQLEQRLSEEKSKLDAEIVAAEEKIRRELEILESERSAQVVVKDEEEVLDIPRPDDAELKVPNDVLESMKGLPTLASTQSDTLATDVEALELISMCEPDYDSKSPSCILPSDYPFVSLLRDSSPYIVNHRHSTIVYHVPGDLISDVEKFNSVMDDIALTWLFGMKIVVCVGCRTQVSKRLDMLQGGRSKHTSGIRITTSEALRVLEEEAGFCRFEVERQLNRCLRNKGADCNVVSGCFITAKKFGEVDGVNYQLTGYPTTLQTHRINHFLSRSDVVLLTPLGFTENGEALNIKSEQLAGFTAGALKASKVVYFSTMPLVMRGSNDSGEANVNQRIQMIQRSSALQILSHHGLKVNSKTGFPHWKSKSTAAALNSDIQAMLLKMGWATDAIDKGVERAHIIPSEDGALLEELFTARRGYGTCISQDDYEAPHPEDQNDDLFAIDEVGAGMVEW
jgi:amino-acid N-acetyltransferase